MTRSIPLSQSAIDTFDRCPRRYYLRYVRGLDWPAPLTSSELDWERRMRLGEQFHLLVHQQALGMPVAPMVAARADATLAEWWSSYQQEALKLTPAAPQALYTEVELAVAVEGVTLVAKFDRVVIDAGGDLCIFDWKTGVPRSGEQLAAAWQSCVYLFVGCERGGVLRRPPGTPRIEPEQVQLIYWHARDPRPVVRLSYDAAAHARGQMRLHRVIQDIQQRQAAATEAAFARTDDEGPCRHCPYRSYWERGREAGAGADPQLAPDVEAWTAAAGPDDLDG